MVNYYMMDKFYEGYKSKMVILTVVGIILDVVTIAINIYGIASDRKKAHQKSNRHFAE